ncbi:winged helix-turn-helix domain-containing protein [Halomarina salina]|uniref:Winged helix-turn-helix domain-containing protein n=1 Tax=Halomarina salina TaxID=1872699 RepID=A0ABD5RNY9_9EURY|nr:helix-turn-helix transcriptional regulator [Halomarina salina]
MDDSAPEFVSDPDAAFAAVADPTRVDVLRALAEHVRETGEQVCRFSTLRKRAGVEDPGRFRYHLEELRGHFVEKVDDGYRFTYAGGEIVGAILAGRYTDHERLGPTPLDGQCSVCGEDIAGRYEQGRIEVDCEAGHQLLSWPLPPNAATHATVAELAGVATSLVLHAVDLSLQGHCPRCYGPTTARIEPSDEGEMPQFRAACDTCAGLVVGPAWFALTVHPTVEAFYHDHDRPIREAMLWELAHVDYEATPADGEGVVRLSARLDDEVLHAVLAETGAVLSTRVEPVE